MNAVQCAFPIFIIFSIMISISLSGCSEGNIGVVLECRSPLIQKGSGCCMDADLNGICDIDEKKETPKETENKTTDEEDKALQQTGSIDDAEKAAKLFAGNWDKKQYNLMYAAFTPTLKAKKSAEEFAAIMTLDTFYKNLNKAEFRGMKSIDGNTAEVALNVYNNLQNITVPGVTAEFIDGSWMMDAFNDVFELPTYDAACFSYRDNNKMTMTDCAFELAKKVKDVRYCNISGCNMNECFRILGQKIGVKEEARQCFDCQPTGKTVNECILQIAIDRSSTAACDVIRDDRYSDKYCKCYGGYAKAKGNKNICNVIQGQDNKNLCIKGFDGGYC